MSNNNDLNEYASSLKTRIWTTKGSRFNAVRRLNNKYQFSLSSISILSIYGIAIPIVQGIVKNPPCKEINDIYNAISLILSIFTLVISLLEGAKNYQLRAEKLHNNAVKLQKLEKNIDYLQVSLKVGKLADADFIQKVHEISDKYDELIEECTENHEPQDYALFKVQNSKDFNISWLDGLSIKIKLSVINYWLYTLLIGTPLLGIPLILFLLDSSC